MIYAQFALVAVSVFAILLYGPGLAHSFSSLSLNSPATLLTASLALSISLSISAELILSYLASSLNTFQLFGYSKMLILPAIYLIIMYLLIRMKGKYSEISKILPVWWWGFAASLLVSTFLAFVNLRQHIQISPAFQGIGLLLGFLLFVLAGATPSQWLRNEKTAFLVLVIASGLFGSISGIDLGPFSPLLIPSGIILLWLGIRLPTHRLLSISLGILVLLPELSTEITLANLSQLGIGLGIILIFVLKRRFRSVLLLFGLIAGVIMAIFSGLGRLLLGDGSGVEDVTLSHRAYETFAVWQQNLSNPVSLVFGLGPSATVDLSRSPDVATLLWSGRDVFRVDDVHFISSWVVLKFGLIGLIALLVMFLWLLRELFVFINQSARVDPFIGSVWLLALSGITFGAPAATYIFTYPLIAIALGILVRYKKYINEHVVANTDTQAVSAP